MLFWMCSASFGLSVCFDSQGGTFAGPKRSDLKAMLENLGNNGEVASGSPRGNNAPNDVEEGKEQVIVVHCLLISLHHPSAFL